jgi:RNA polymerase sigma-70 factor, ECF subfamily
MIPHVDEEQFYRDLMNAQRGLYAFIVRLIPHAEDANDVLQETNVVLLSKKKEFRVGENFNAWAAGIARFQVLAFRRDAGRNRVVFSEPLLDQLAAKGVLTADRMNVMFEAMELCRNKLDEAERQLLDFRYSEGLSVAEIAKNLGRTPRAITQSLYRIRITLLECIERTACSLERANAR